MKSFMSILFLGSVLLAFGYADPPTSLLEIISKCQPDGMPCGVFCFLRELGAIDAKDGRLKCDRVKELARAHAMVGMGCLMVSGSCNSKADGKKFCEGATAVVKCGAEMILPMIVG